VRNVSSCGQPEPIAGDPVRDLAPQAEIHELIGDKLALVEEQFRDNLASPVAIVEEIGSFVAQSGGKRVRPTAHLLAARLCEYEGPHDVLLATVLEFIHSATLIHDDIIDEAQVRRGRPSVNSNWGNNVTVLFGDYLFAKAMEMALGAGSLEVMRRLADVTLRMTEGEMLQTRYEGRLDLTVPEYLDLIEKKTAALFGACCELGGVLAGTQRQGHLGVEGRDAANVEAVDVARIVRLESLHGVEPVVDVLDRRHDLGSLSPFGQRC
jgi:geranylgeranyl pyrophosphate synthase